MEHASTAWMPAFLPVDGHDLHVALTEIDRRLNAMHPGRLGDRALLGYSMGAFDSLYIAGTAPTNQLPLLKFDRYVAIDPPVRLLHGASELDKSYEAPLAWPAAERTDNIENTFLKVAALSKSKLTAETPLPFNAIESRFLIGLTFRFSLRDIIYSSHRRHNMGVLRHALLNYRRAPAYREILRYSYQDYFSKFVTPYYQARGMAAPAAETLDKADDLRTYGSGLRANPRVRVLVNHNDILLTGEDLAWFRATFAPENLTVFPQGGHVGNLFKPVVQKTILAALAGLTGD
jgi:pimeloyl-ACP methyl ester carboxylesterase